jgi:putative transposase
MSTAVSTAIRRHKFGALRMSMTPKKKRSKTEIAAMLVQADDLAKQGVFQSEIARTLGVSVMTLYRWRKVPPGPPEKLPVPDEVTRFEKELGSGQRIAELELENARLRRLVTDLLLENMKIAEAAQGKENSPRRGTKRSVP